jgi:chromosome segregation protein
VRLAADLVKAPGEFAPAVAGLLDGVAVAPDLAQAREVLSRHPGLRVVTMDGDLLGAHWARGGTAGPQSLIGLRAAAAEATTGLREADLACQHAERQLAEASDEEARARQAAAEALAGLQEADAAAAEISGRLGTLAGAAKAATDEASRLAARIAAAGRGQEKDQARLAELEHQLEQADAEADAARADQTAADLTPAQARAERERLAGLAAAARDTEMDCRLEVRTAEERLRAITGRADSLTAAAATERQARERALARAQRRAREAALAQAVAEGASAAVVRITESLAVADAERQAAEVASRGRGDRLKEVRGQIRLLAGELDKVVDTAHGAEIAQAARRMQLDQLATRAVEEYAVEVAELVAEYGPEVGVPPGDDDALPVPYDRAAQEKRAQSAQRLLDQLGKVNPLALEEFAALEERHAFLVTQLEDLKKTRRDLLTVIKEVDERVQQVFTEAYADTAREFERTFDVLFPGGQGRLVLTDPDDMLTTGIDFEARPPGKKVKRLSLLSGGERALTAIAFLVAIFKARPSPFYVLDEVEAALDDTNLQRLLHLFEELRESSQLIIVTHQKRTMEVADSLYGISMRGDGVSTVVSQRLRERESA